MSKFRQIVSIEWEGDDDLDENWLCPDNIAMCITGFCVAKNVRVRRYPDSPLGNVREIVVEYLKENGWGGLCNDDCGCGLDDFAPCGQCLCDCLPAMRKFIAGDGFDVDRWIYVPGVLVDGKIVEREK